ncbi:cadherin repeat domain-containing protein, partial [Geitlerinema sp. PCC 9228]|uniref:cadherin repeat domain-containing protein n=1 Tax=Geitlerinema sp. PCC 9228 TaxID=111611 RepID=UPI00147ECF70
VTDINEFSPSQPSDSDSSDNQIAENASNGTSVGITASSSDPDSSDTVTYSLQNDAGGRFAIDDNSGEVTVA